MAQSKKPLSFKLNATAASLLGFLLERPMTGWDIVKAAEERIGNFWTLTPSQVYRELQSLATHDLIKAGPKGARDSQPYTITVKGKKNFITWLQQTPEQETIRFPLLISAVFSRHIPPDQFRHFIEKHYTVHNARLTEYELMYKTLRSNNCSESELMTLSFGVAYEKMVLEWMKKQI